jgi:hypothetical protein
LVSATLGAHETSDSRSMAGAPLRRDRLGFNRLVEFA